jgi:hypothetical protein
MQNGSVLGYSTIFLQCAGFIWPIFIIDECWHNGFDSTLIMHSKHSLLIDKLHSISRYPLLKHYTRPGVNGLVVESILTSFLPWMLAWPRLKNTTIVRPIQMRTHLRCVKILLSIMSDEAKYCFQYSIHRRRLNIFVNIGAAKSWRASSRWLRRQ